MKLEQKQVKSNNRIHFVDALRGIAIILMVTFHLFYSMTYVFYYPIGAKLLMTMMPIEPLIAGAFILLAGFSSQLSHSNLMRGVKLLGVAIAITIVTMIAVPDIAILFGILHFLSIAMILFSFIKPYINKIPIRVGLLGSALLFVLCYGIPNGVIGIPNIMCIKLPQWLYSTDFLFALGFPSAGFVSSDYFPMLPWIFLFLFGSFLGNLATVKPLPQFMYKKWVPPLCFLGRHSLIIYVVHQPVIVAVLWAINNIFSH